MKHTDNIEQLFKENLEGFEADVNPQVWANVQTGINSVSGGIASGAAKFAIGKIIAGAASVVLVAGSAWYYTTSTGQTGTSVSAMKEPQAQVASKEEVSVQQNVSASNTPANSVSTNNTTTASPVPPAIRSLNHYGSDYSQQMQTGNVPRNESAAEAAPAENTGAASSQQQSKYGKSTEGPTPIIRGSLKQNPREKSKKASVAAQENTETEQAPSANISASTESGDVPLAVNFSNQGLPSGLTWDFGDGSSSNENTPSHTYTKPGNYTVKLTAQNNRGSNADKIIIEARSISGIDPCNVFTPNGDGENDMLSFKTRNIASMEIIISNMAGAPVARWNTVEGGWDGKLANGNDAPEGLYLYAGHAVGTDGVIHPVKGSVTLSRKR